MMEKLEDIDNFLENVDKISELVMDLKSSDAQVQQKAMEKADCYIAASEEPCRTKVNKTTINTNPSAQTFLSLQSHGTVRRQATECQEVSLKLVQIVNIKNFLKMMEKDAETRRVRRTEQEKIATALKDRGNEAYAKEDYETAVKFYTDGLAELRDMQPLYTNRAQAFIKLGKYQQAINDCEWALKCNERCIKAYLHMGKAYLALKKYNESRSCFERIVEIEPGRDKMMKEYLIQVDLEEEKESQEISALQEFEREDVRAKTVPQLLEMLSRPGQMPFYYCGGFEILSQAVTECTGQTLFRLRNGFSIISSNDIVRRCLTQKTKDPDSQELSVSVLKLWRVICHGNDENQKMLMTCPVSRQSIVNSMTSDHAGVQKECLALLSLFSQSPRGRRLAIDNLNVHWLARNLMACITTQQQQQQLEYTAVNILENFTAENKFCIQLRNVLQDVLFPFTTALRNISQRNQHVLPPLISAMGCLARDDVIRHTFAHDPECWKAFLFAIVSVIIRQKHCSACEHKDVLYPLLGLIINLSAVTSPVIQEHAVSLCECCMGLLRDNNGSVITRATGALSTVLPQSSEAIQHVVQRDVVRTMHRLLKRNGQMATKYAMKTLTVCTAASVLAREELLKSDKKLSVLRRLLGSSSDEMVTGNAALCLAHCFELEGTASSLLGTDIVSLLLRHAAAEAERTALQRNAAIALGKLCRTEPRHMNKLRELHGLEILHSCMKVIT